MSSFGPTPTRSSCTRSRSCPGLPTPPELDIRPQASGAPLFVFPANVANPTGGDTYTGQGYFNSGLMFGGATFAAVIDAPAGVYSYLCLIHSGALAESGGGPPMKGTIRVIE
ncbi:MAG: hypothetical protein U0531_01380 [Dehalococcoidia bacterium]